jgi:SgrR family transcriptional regulator
MKIRRHYLTLRRSFPHIHEDEPLETTLEELAASLDCTNRNMVLLLKRMQQEHWLTWTPRRGRGNRSILIFTARKDELLLQEAQDLVGKQDLQSALRLIQADDSSSLLLRPFQEWLSGQFGFRSEVRGQRRTDILRFPLLQTIQTLDPASIHYSGESHLVNQVFDGLVRMDAKGEHILPHLAHAWEVDATRTIWTFYLRKGIFFHHGREMLASDVSYSLERLRKHAPRGLYSWAYTGIASMNILDDTTIQIMLHERNEAFLAFLTTNRASIVPQDRCEAEGEQFGRLPVGTGPFRVVGEEQGIWILEAYPHYFQGRGFLDRVEVWTLPESSHGIPERLQPFQIMHNVRLSDSDSMDWQQVRQSGMTCKFITVNELKVGPATKGDLRNTIRDAIDKAYLLEKLSGDVLEAGDSFWASSEAPVRPLNASDLKQIRHQLMSSGYQDETLRLATIPQYEADAKLIQQVCARVGLVIAIDLIPAEQFKGQARMAADLLLFAVMLDEHRELRLIDLYKSMQQHAAPEVQAMLERKLRLIQIESDNERRRSNFVEIEDQLKQRSSLLFLYRKHLKTAFHPSIRGISLDSLGWVRFRDIWYAAYKKDS